MAYSKYRSLATALACCSLAILWAESASAQRGPKPPESLTVKTKDGVTLALSYYASSAGKEAVPVVMLPDWKDSRNVYDTLARKLQEPGEDDDYPSFAVITVDLRGHGDSTKQRAPNGAERELDAAKLGRQDFAAMYTQDMEAIRKFLVDKNDAGELNLNNLTLLGSGMGAMVAVNWAFVDWSAPPLAVKKQGQDVKALMLISPQWRWKGVPIQESIRHPGIREKVAFLMMFGKRNRSISSDVKRIHSAIERYHPEPESPNDDPRDLVVLPAGDNDLQGTQLLTEARAAGEEEIIKFLKTFVVSAEHEWIKRRID